mmetsp:Transcript_3288/g.7539  ORF Transcript_3288/g.7539 Transcript_3288/m.7539 type:complete len:209 (+) Transcript_3288:306-932(+)
MSIIGRAGDAGEVGGHLPAGQGGDLVLVGEVSLLLPPHLGNGGIVAGQELPLAPAPVEAVLLQVGLDPLGRDGTAVTGHGGAVQELQEGRRRRVLEADVEDGRDELAVQLVRPLEALGPAAVGLGRLLAGAGTAASAAVAAAAAASGAAAALGGATALAGGRSGSSIAGGGWRFLLLLGRSRRRCCCGSGYRRVGYLTVAADIRRGLG